MFCKYCGSSINNEDKFCIGCGRLVQNNESTTIENHEEIKTAYMEESINPNMRKWAVLSIVIPVVAIIWYIFIGLSFYIAVLIASVGLSFAKKGEMADAKLAKIGTVLNYILMIIAVIMLILIILNMI